MTKNSFGPVLFSFILGGCGHTLDSSQQLILNDRHSRLNPTRLSEIITPQSTRDIVKIIKRAKREKKPVSISGGMHAMGGQQFGEQTIHINTSKFNDVVSFDPKLGIIRVESGIQWPELIRYLTEKQKGLSFQWSINQKQTGADRLSIGGALSANVHGRGAKMRPIIQDVAAFTLVDADGKILKISRQENSELFRLVIGGYGLFGVIAEVDLKLQPRQKFKRFVELVPLENLYDKAKQRLEEGFLYGDYQYKTDEEGSDFLKIGILSTYQPVDINTPIPGNQKKLTPEQWRELLVLAHTDKSMAFELYSRHYLKTDGQIYWSDWLQTGFYDENYFEYVQEKLPHLGLGSLMITETYVPRKMLQKYLETVSLDARNFHYPIIYGTIRLIEKDEESFLNWAKANYACVIFNLRVEHSAEGLKKAGEQFIRIIDRALEMDGSYYLTYHRFARKDQILKAYPQFPEFLKLKLKYDPEERFQSEWYRFYKKMFSNE